MKKEKVMLNNFVKVLLSTLTVSFVSTAMQEDNIDHSSNSLKPKQNSINGIKINSENTSKKGLDALIKSHIEIKKNIKEQTRSLLQKYKKENKNKTDYKKEKNEIKENEKKEILIEEQKLRFELLNEIMHTSDISALIEIKLEFMDRFGNFLFENKRTTYDMLFKNIDNKGDWNELFIFINAFQNKICKKGLPYKDGDFSQQINYLNPFFKTFSESEGMPNTLKKILSWNIKALDGLGNIEKCYKKYVNFNIFNNKKLRMAEQKLINSNLEFNISLTKYYTNKLNKSQKQRDKLRHEYFIAAHNAKRSFEGIMPQYNEWFNKIKTTIDYYEYKNTKFKEWLEDRKQFDILAHKMMDTIRECSKNQGFFFNYFLKKYGLSNLYTCRDVINAMNFFEEKNLFVRENSAKSVNDFIYKINELWGSFSRSSLKSKSIIDLMEILKHYHQQQAYTPLKNSIDVFLKALRCHNFNEIALNEFENCMINFIKKPRREWRLQRREDDDLQCITLKCFEIDENMDLGLIEERYREERTRKIDTNIIINTFYKDSKENIQKNTRDEIKEGLEELKKIVSLFSPMIHNDMTSLLKVLPKEIDSLQERLASIYNFINPDKIIKNNTQNVETINSFSRIFLSKEEQNKFSNLKFSSINFLDFFNTLCSIGEKFNAFNEFFQDKQLEGDEGYRAVTKLYQETESKKKDFFQKMDKFFIVEDKISEEQPSFIKKNALKSYKSILESTHNIEEIESKTLTNKDIISFYFSLKSNGVSLKKIFNKMEKTFFSIYQEYENLLENAPKENEIQKSFSFVKTLYEKILNLKTKPEVQYLSPNAFVTLMNMFKNALETYEDHILLKAKESYDTLCNNKKINPFILFFADAKEFKKKAQEISKQLISLRGKKETPWNDCNSPAFYLFMENLIVKKQYTYEYNGEIIEGYIEAALCFFNEKKTFRPKELEKIISTLERAVKKYPYASVFMHALACAYEKNDIKPGRIFQLYERAHLLGNSFSTIKLASCYKEKFSGWKNQNDLLNYYKGAFVKNNPALNWFLIQMNWQNEFVENTFEIDLGILLEMDLKGVDQDQLFSFFLDNIKLGAIDINNSTLFDKINNFFEVNFKESQGGKVIQILLRGKKNEKEIFELIKNNKSYRDKKKELYSLYLESIKEYTNNQNLKEALELSFDDLKNNLRPYILPKKVECDYSFLKKEINEQIALIETIGKKLSLQVQQMRSLGFSNVTDELKLLLEENSIIKSFINRPKNISLENFEKEHENAQEQIKSIEKQLLIMVGRIDEIMHKEKMIRQKFLAIKNPNCNQSIEQIYADLEKKFFMDFRSLDSKLKSYNIEDEKILIKFYKCENIYHFLNEINSKPNRNILDFSDFYKVVKSFEAAFLDLKNMVDNLNIFDSPSKLETSSTTQPKKPTKNKSENKNVKDNTPQKNSPVKQNNASSISKITLPKQQNNVIIHNQENLILKKNLSKNSGLCSEDLIEKINLMEKRKKIQFVKKHDFIETLKICETLSDMIATMGKTAIRFHTLLTKPAKIEKKIRDILPNNEVMCSLSIAGDTKYRLVIIFNKQTNKFDLNTLWVGNYHSN